MDRNCSPWMLRALSVYAPCARPSSITVRCTRPSATAALASPRRVQARASAHRHLGTQPCLHGRVQARASVIACRRPALACPRVLSRVGRPARSRAGRPRLSACVLAAPCAGRSPAPHVHLRLRARVPAVLRLGAHVLAALCAGRPPRALTSGACCFSAQDLVCGERMERERGGGIREREKRPIFIAGRHSH